MNDKSRECSRDFFVDVPILQIQRIRLTRLALVKARISARPVWRIEASRGQDSAKIVLSVRVFECLKGYFLSVKGVF